MKKPIKLLLAGLFILGFNFVIYQLGQCATFIMCFSDHATPKDYLIHLCFALLFIIGAIIVFYVYRFKLISAFNDKTKAITYGFLCFMTFISMVFPILTIVSYFNDSVSTIFFDSLRSEYEARLEASTLGSKHFIDAALFQVLISIGNWFFIARIPHCPKCGLVGKKAEKLIDSRCTGSSTRSYTYYEDVYVGTTESKGTATFSDGSTQDVTVTTRNYERTPRTGTHTSYSYEHTFHCEYCHHTWKINV